MPLNPNRLAAQALDIRNRAETFLLDTVLLRRKIGESTVDGEPVIAYASDVEIPCRWINRIGNNPRNRDPITAQQSIQIPFNTQIAYGDVFIDPDGASFIIEYIPQRHTLAGDFIIDIVREA